MEKIAVEQFLRHFGTLNHPNSHLRSLVLQNQSKSEDFKMVCYAGYANLASLNPA